MLLRTVSFLNPQATASIQDTLKSGFQRNSNGLLFISETAKWRSQFTIPFKGGDMLKEFTDVSVLTKLELQDAILNWDAKFVRLHPLTTASDNNCLCHGICYTLTGAQDRNYLLRNAIESTISTDSEACRWFRNQWKKFIVAQDVASFGMEIERSPEQWDEEWLEELKLVQDHSKSLTEIHVLVLAHVVRRPIVVYSPQFTKDVDGNPLAPIYFGGIYLPLLWDPMQMLSRTPLLLAYNDSHFTALIPEVTQEGQVAPLADKDGRCFPIKFADDDKLIPGSPPWLQMARRYVDIVTDGVPCISAKISKGMAELAQDLLNYAKNQTSPISKEPVPEPVPVAMYAKPFRTPRKAETADVAAPTDDDIPQAQVAGLYVAPLVKAGHVKVGKVELQAPPPGNPEQASPQKWTCSRCHIQNSPTDDECTICGTERQSSPAAAKVQRPPDSFPAPGSPMVRHKSPSLARGYSMAQKGQDTGPKGQLYSNACSPKVKKAAAAQPTSGKAVKVAARPIPQSPARFPVETGTVIARPKAVAKPAPAGQDALEMSFGSFPPKAPGRSPLRMPVEERNQSPLKQPKVTPVKTAPDAMESPVLQASPKPKVAPVKIDAVDSPTSQAAPKSKAPPVKTDAVDSPTSQATPKPKGSPVKTADVVDSPTSQAPPKLKALPVKTDTVDSPTSQPTPKPKAPPVKTVPDAVEPVMMQSTPKPKIAVPFQVGLATAKFKTPQKAHQAQEASLSVVTSGKAKLHVQEEEGHFASPAGGEVAQVPVARVEATPPPQRKPSLTSLAEPKEKEKISVPFHVGIAAVKFKAGVRASTSTPQRSTAALISPSHGRAQLHGPPNGAVGADTTAVADRTPSPAVQAVKRPEIPLLQLGAKLTAQPEPALATTSPWLAAIERSPRVTPVRVSSAEQGLEVPAAAASAAGADPSKSPRGAVRTAGIVRPAWPSNAVEVTPNRRSSPPRAAADATQGWPAAVAGARTTPRSAYSTTSKPTWGAATSLDFPQPPGKVGAWKLPPGAATSPNAPKPTTTRDVSPANWGTRR
eukprot:GGOE01058777.1.p1 GENE.GGOE01058777.1~~GGOE01058777.1.p1  ORF type:complete len:1040 (-),score=169.46 GGOE01058777.1:992-4111(-)